ncbi:hypothetical protein HDU85_004307 [Gaertneriomyces sp. JEL0708]|nr:hypothetical protein HDU85_004307 [Gaertneriomyces sp. JEL0708]
MPTVVTSDHPLASIPCVDPPVSYETYEVTRPKRPVIPRRCDSAPQPSKQGLGAPRTSDLADGSKQSLPSEYIKHPVASTDSLQRLSLLYDTTIAEIKRLNRIWNEQELHLRKTVLVPCPKSGQPLAFTEDTVSPATARKPADSSSEQTIKDLLSQIDSDLCEIRHSLPSPLVAVSPQKLHLYPPKQTHSLPTSPVTSRKRSSMKSNVVKIRPSPVPVRKETSHQSMAVPVRSQLVSSWTQHDICMMNIPAAAPIGSAVEADI